MKDKITISFLANRDEDLIQYLETKRNGNLSEYIRQLIRDDMEGKTSNRGNNEEIIAKILEEIKTLKGNTQQTSDNIEDILDMEEIEDTINNLF